jgi:hypothetical protein
VDATNCRNFKPFSNKEKTMIIRDIEYFQSVQADKQSKALVGGEDFTFVGFESTVFPENPTVEDIVTGIDVIGINAIGEALSLVGINV